MTPIPLRNRSANRFLLVAAIALVSFIPAAAVQASDVVARVSTSSVQVAQPFSLEITVTAPTGAKVVFPSWDGQLGQFDVLDTQDLFDIPDGSTSDARTWTRRMMLESIVTGDLSIPPIEIQVTGAGGSKVIRSDSIPVRVVSVLEDRSDPTQFRDIQSVVDVAVPETRSNAWAWWVLGSVAGIGFLTAAGAFVSRRNQWLTPKEWAFQQLDQLGQAVDSPSADSPPATSEAVSMELSKIVREYLLLQFAIAESGRTAQELVQVIESRELVGPQIAMSLNALFHLADKAKFAGLDLSQTGLQSVIRDSRELIQQISDQTEAKTPTPDATENK